MYVILCIHINCLLIFIDSTVEVFVSETNVFTGILFQDKAMSSTFGAFPEVLMIDATYKLNDLRMPLYLLMVIDGNGQSEIVASFLSTLETEEAITKMIQAFKIHNAHWAETKVIITDKDFTERTVLKKEFPDASLVICFFHTLRSMRREVTCQKLGILPGERDHALELLTTLAYSASPQEYDDNYKDLKVSGLKSVIEYYDANWHPIRQEWVQCFVGINFTLGERTTNRLESINAKVKSVCSKYASLNTFFDEFNLALSCLRNERNHSNLMALVKKTVLPFPPDSPEIQFTELLMPYAASYVRKQLVLRVKVKIDEDNGVVCKVFSSSGILSVTDDRCQCSFWLSMGLPCRHIFAVREKSPALYSRVGISPRWTIEYMRRRMSPVVGDEESGSTVQVSSYSQKVELALLYMYYIG